MAAMRTIRRVEVFPIRLPVTRGFTFASGSAGKPGEGAPFALVKMTDSRGGIGWGEGRPVPAWSYETLESVTSTIRRYLAPAVLGTRVGDAADLHRRMHRVIGRGPSTGMPIAKAAVDIAFHDLAARAAGKPLHVFLGGRSGPATVRLSYTVTAHDARGAAADVEAGRAEGFSHFNFKAAVDPRTDAAVARAVRRAAGPEAFVWADANQGFNLAGARRAARAFAAAGVDVLEQPLPADRPDLHAALRRGCRLLLAVDEATVSPGDFRQYIGMRAVNFLIVKLTRSGGIHPTREQLALARAARLPFLVSGLTDGLLTKLAACSVAAAYGFGGPAALNGSQFMDESALYPDKRTVERYGNVHLPAGPGLGVRPDERAVRRLVVRGVG